MLLEIPAKARKDSLTANAEVPDALPATHSLESKFPTLSQD